jgi:drug efflux transport system permease protein
VRAAAKRRLAESPFWPMLWKEFVQMRRDRLTLAMLVVIPAIQLIVFGFAIRTEVRDLRTVVLDESRSSESRALIDVMRNTGNFAIVGTVTNRAELRERIERGSAQAAIVIPPEYQRDLKRGRTAQVQVIIDAADPLSSNAAIGGATLAGAARSAALLDPAGARTVPIDVRVRPWYNPALRSSAFIVPGIIGVLLSMTLVVIMSMAIVREREHGTLEQLVVTPIDKTSLMLGKILPFVVVGYVQMTVVLVLGKLLFDTPIRGSLLLLYALTAAFIVANLGLGLFISTAVKTQVQATQLGLVFLMPNILLSGFMFPRDAMPDIARWIGAALPLTYYLHVLRGVLLKDAGLSALWPDALILAAFATALVGLSVARFRKTIA